MNSVRKFLTFGLVSFLLTQTIVAQSISTNAISIQCEDQVFGLNADVNEPNCMADIQLRAAAFNDPTCSLSALISWIVYVDKDGNGVDDLEFSSFLSPMDVDLTTDSNGNGIVDYYLPPSKEGVSPFIPELKWPASYYSHNISWNAVDSCGNRATCHSIVKVKDLNPPTIGIILTDTLDANGGERKEIMAAQFNAASHDNCTAEDKLWFTFDGAYPVTSLQNMFHYFKGKGINADVNEYNRGIAQYWNPTLNTSSKMLICDGSGNKTVSQQISVWDEYLNTDSAFVQIFLSRFDCVENSLVGKVTNISNQSIPHVLATIERIGRDEHWYFYFSEEYRLNLFIDWYKVKLDKRNDFRNGITGADLYVLLRHINGQELLNSPEKLLAADINADGKVTMEDFFELYELSTGIKDTFSNNDSWIFLPSPYSFKDESQPYEIERTALVDLAVQTQQDFTGIKVGDVNQSTLNPKVDEIVSTITLTTDERWIQKGEEVVASFWFQEKTDLRGWQINWQINGLNNAVVESSLETQFEEVEFEDISSFISYAVLNETTNLKKEGEVFRIRGKAERDGLLSSFLSFDKDEGSIIYTGKEVASNKLLLSYLVPREQRQFEVYESIPNPFVDATEIKYYLPSPGEVQYTLYNASGQVLWDKKHEGNGGRNYLQIKGEDLQKEGLYYVSLRYKDQVKTKPVIFER